MFEISKNHFNVEDPTSLELGYWCIKNLRIICEGSHYEIEIEYKFGKPTKIEGKENIEKVFKIIKEKNKKCPPPGFKYK